jgi:two-component system cell cycle sensor histidine kinase/response regulator CckA
MDQPTVLLVEDMEPVRRLLTRILVDAGYRVLAAAAGLAALDHTSQAAGTLDLALVDLGLEGEDGAILVEAMQRLQPGLPVMFMTGDMFLARLHPLPGPVLLKPFTPDVLTESIREYLATGTCARCLPPSSILRRAGNE